VQRPWLFATQKLTTTLVSHRCDVLESLWYILLYFLGGCLTAANQGQKKELILVKKQKTSREDLYKGLPRELTAFFDHLRSCGIGDGPRCSYLRKILCGFFDGEVSIMIICSIGQS